MSESMVERAKAAFIAALIAEHEALDDGGAHIRTDREGKTELDGRFDLTAAMRAAIASIREPTEAMIEAGMAEEEVDLASEWRAMVDAMLKD